MVYTSHTVKNLNMSSVVTILNKKKSEKVKYEKFK